MKYEKLTNEYGLILNSSDPGEFVKLGKDQLHKMLAEHGALLFRAGNSFKRDHFVELSKNFSDQFIIHGAKVRRPMSEDGTVQTVTEGPDAIVLHSEMHFSPFAPDYMWFFCETAPSRGGETTICDGELFFRSLPEKLQKELLSKKLLYWNLWDVDVWQKYFAGNTPEEVIQIFAAKGSKAWFNEKNELEFEIVKSALTKSERGNYAFVNAIAVHHQYFANLKMFEAKGQASKLRHRISFEDRTPIPAWIPDQINETESKHVHPLKWQDGDLILLDNNRMLHGRNSFDPAIKRSILVRMAMVGSRAA